MAKATTGLRDVWSYLTKDSASFDWESKGQLEHAVKIVYNESCKECHKQLYPSRISQDGITAHLYYEENEQKLDLQCISCHLDVGHYDPNYKHERMKGVPQQAARRGEPYAAPAEVVAFENFTETVPGTTVSFDMKAIPGGTFSMGSPEDEPFRRDDEGPVRQVTVSPFFMGETEVTWDMYWAFYSETMTEGRTPPEVVYANNSDPDVDAVSGPTAAKRSCDNAVICCVCIFSLCFHSLCRLFSLFCLVFGRLVLVSYLLVVRAEKPSKSEIGRAHV